AARHRPDAGVVHLRDQRPPFLVRRVLRQGILGRGVLVGVLRRDRLRAHLLGGERPGVRPAAHRRGAARRAPLAESGRRRPQRGAKYAICPFRGFISSSRPRAAGIIARWSDPPGGENLEPTSPRNSENPSLYDPAVALDFFQFAGKPQSVAKGTTIFSENRRGMPLLLMPNRIYLLLEGEVGVLAKDEPIATIQAGEVFGEMASMGQMPRSASAVARSDCRVVGLDDKQFRAALGRNPGFALMLMSIMIRRLRDSIASLGVPAADTGWREAAALDAQLLADLAQMLGPAARFRYEAGRIIMREGQLGVALFALLEGRVAIRIGDSVVEKVG